MTPLSEENYFSENVFYSLVFLSPFGLNALGLSAGLWAKGPGCDNSSISTCNWHIATYQQQPHVTRTQYPSKCTSLMCLTKVCPVGFVHRSFSRGHEPRPLLTEAVEWVGIWNLQRERSE